MIEPKNDKRKTINQQPANPQLLLYLPILTNEERYMFRCLELARLGAGYVAPNPMVGAVLVHENTIIGEGYH
ncbi:hypothetical protein AB9E30_39305, partial [Rhizobium leguminosarum]